jgi:hypothetical protein
MSGDKHKNDATWGPGQSGNPGGRSPRVGPNGETVVQLARAHTSLAIDRLVAIINAQDDDMALRAAVALLDRGWGKPKETLDLDANVRGATVTRIELVAVKPDDSRTD